MVDPGELAWIDAEAMREIDRLMVDEVGIVLLQMMENAGRSLAAVVRREVEPSAVLVLAGPGGNGGGGLVAARHLANAGIDVLVVLSADRGRFGEVPAHQLGIIDRLGVDVVESDDARQVEVGRADAVVDAMVGYSLRGELRGPAASLADSVNAGGAHVVSLDVPSGLPADGGAVGLVVDAAATVTLCLPKIGLRGRREVGRLFVADISGPASIVAAVTDDLAPPFDRGPILSIG